jgi:hypothetical protein
MATAYRAEIHGFFAPRLDRMATVQIVAGARLRMTGVAGNDLDGKVREKTQSKERKSIRSVLA